MVPEPVLVMDRPVKVQVPVPAVMVPALLKLPPVDGESPTVKLVPEATVITR